jgi:regulator of sigma E protease
MNWVIVIAGLVAIVFIHELGHFSAALAVGMRPRSFYIGFPPAIVKIKRRGIEYGIGAIPFGGFVRLPGMHRPAARDVQILLEPAVAEQPELAPFGRRVRRALTAEDYDAARVAYAELDEEIAGAHLSAGARRPAMRALRDVEEGTAPDAYWRAPTWKRITVIAAGPAANVVMAFLILFAVYGVSGAPSTSPAKILGVKAKNPAAAAGLRSGDILVSVNGRRADLGNVADLIQSSHGGPLTLGVDRHGDRLTIGPTRPVWFEGHWILGIGLTPIRLPVGAAATAAGSDLWNITSGTVAGLAALFQPHSSAREHLTSLPGIARDQVAALNVSVAWYFQILALVSMSLALLNLIPLLPLDGGHILFSLIESVRRRALAREVYERVSLAGLALILLVFVIALHNDTKHIFG